MLPTTREGMNCAIGQFIWGVVSEKIAVEQAAFAASPAASDPDFNPYAPKKSEPKKSDREVLAAFCARVKAEKAARAGARKTAR